MLGGDYNDNRKLLDPRCTKRRDAAYCDEISFMYGVVTGINDRPTQYWTRNDSDCASILDLNQANRLIFCCFNHSVFALLRV